MAKNMMIRMDDRQVERISEIAKKLNLPTSTMARNLIDVGLMTASVYDAVGVFALLLKMREWKETLNGEMESAERA